MKRIYTAIDQSLINSILIFPQSITLLSTFLSKPLINLSRSQLNIYENNYDKILEKMNPLIMDDECEEDFEKGVEENSQNNIEHKLIDILINDNVSYLQKFISENSNYGINKRDRKNISLIEKSIFFKSKKCIKYLLEENASIERDTIEIGDLIKYDIGVMEYGAMRGNKEIIQKCLEKGQKISIDTIIISNICHQNEFSKWLIEIYKGKNKDIEIENFSKILGRSNNIEINEYLLKNVDCIEAKDNKRKIEKIKEKYIRKNSIILCK